MATISTTAAALNTSLPAFYALPITAGSKLPTSVNPFPNPLPVLNQFLAATFASSGQSIGSLVNIFDTITISGSTLSGVLPPLGSSLTLAGALTGTFVVLNTSGVSPNVTITFANQTNQTVTSFGATTWLSGVSSGASTSGTVTMLGGVFPAQSASGQDPSGAGQSFAAVWFSNPTQTFDVGAVYQPSNSTNWVLPMGLISASTTHAVFSFPADVAPVPQTFIGVSFVRVSDLPVVGDVLALTDSTNQFTFTRSVNDAQYNYWRISA